MDGMTLLNQARSAGLVVMVEGNILRIRGPRSADPIARNLIAYKPAVVDALKAEIVPQAIPASPNDLPPDWQSVWEERAAIMEYDGGMSKEDADAAALKDTIRQMREGKRILDDSVSIQ